MAPPMAHLYFVGIFSINPWAIANSGLSAKDPLCANGLALGNEALLGWLSICFFMFGLCIAMLFGCVFVGSVAKIIIRFAAGADGYGLRRAFYYVGHIWNNIRLLVTSIAIWWVLAFLAPAKIMGSMLKGDDDWLVLSFHSFGLLKNHC